MMLRNKSRELGQGCGFKGCAGWCDLFLKRNPDVHRYLREVRAGGWARRAGQQGGHQGQQGRQGQGQRNNGEMYDGFKEIEGDFVNSKGDINNGNNPKE